MIYEGTVMTGRVITKTAPEGLLQRLEGVMQHQGVDALAERLSEMRGWIAEDLASIESDLDAVERRPTPLHESVHHLLSLKGKRLRPLCVALASRTGEGFGPAARLLAVAVELIHSATLLHDDVVDLGDTRRGARTARVIYGNAASIFAGDWLLIEALRRVREAGIPELSDGILEVLREMLDAEGLQLASRGVLPVLSPGVAQKPDMDRYFQVIEGKTAALFRFAMYAGGRAGRHSELRCEALGAFGMKLGVAFQIQDDLLDLSGDPEIVGKGLFNDLREGKLTYPFLLSLARDPHLAPLLAEAGRGGEIDPCLSRRITESLRDTHCLEDSALLVQKLTAEAVSHLEALPESRARAALEGVALAMLERKK